MIKSLFRVVNYLKKIMSWKYDFIVLRNEQVRKDLPKTEINQRAIILIPHADDEWIGCSSIIMSNKDTLLVNMDMQGGDSHSLHLKRMEELQKISFIYNRKIVNVVSAKEKTLVDIINRFCPTHIYLPFYCDWHEEHIIVMNLLKKALKDIKFDVRIAMYQVSLPLLSSMCSHANPMCKKEWQTKWNTFRQIYKTQLKIPYNRFSMNEKINGKLINSYAAEVFCICSKWEWLNNMDIWLLTNAEKNYIRQNLQSLRQIYKYLDLCYDKRLNVK